MKLFMKSYYEKAAREVKPPLEYEAICISCAGKLGGKINDQSVAWLVKKCDCCGLKAQVTKPRNFIWRS